MSLVQNLIQTYPAFSGHNQKQKMKTTILGILTIVGAIVGAATQFLTSGSIDLLSIVPAVTAGFGLIKAKDQ